MSRRRVELREAQDRFVAVWGKMGSAWGISRTMAEVHALLLISGQPLCTDDVMERLEISRGNASMSLRALVDWGVVARVHRRGDRKEYYAAEQDVWAMFRAILRERMKREVEPAVAALFEIRDLTPGKRGETDPQTEAHNQRLDDLLQAMMTMEKLAAKFIGPSGGGLLAAASALDQAASVVGAVGAVGARVGAAVGRVLRPGARPDASPDDTEDRP